MVELGNFSRLETGKTKRPNVLENIWSPQTFSVSRITLLEKRPFGGEGGFVSPSGFVA
jgi:hypothetical protein